AGNATPTGPCQPASRTSVATSALTTSGVDSAGVPTFRRSVSSRPAPASTTAHLMPLPPMSIPNTRLPVATGTDRPPRPRAILAAPYPAVTPRCDRMGTMAEELLAIAVDLARRAGALVAEGRARAGLDRARLDVQSKSTPTDVVTAMDRASERFLVGELQRLRPGDAILGEEGGPQAGSTGVRWVVDPIDGTVNYLYGLPQYAVSVAAEVAGRGGAGAGRNPGRGEAVVGPGRRGGVAGP